jgi:DNA-directed RNA polymerase subunit RPC12/RpoP
MVWVRCSRCGHDEFKISIAGVVQCAKCQTRVPMEIRRIEIETYCTETPQPSPKFPSHPDILGQYTF